MIIKLLNDRVRLSSHIILNNIIQLAHSNIIYHGHIAIAQKIKVGNLSCMFGIDI